MTLCGVEDGLSENGKSCTLQLQEFLAELTAIKESNPQNIDISWLLALNNKQQNGQLHRMVDCFHLKFRKGSH